jgi:hypothetical protein
MVYFPVLNPTKVLNFEISFGHDGTLTIRSFMLIMKTLKNPIDPYEQNQFLNFPKNIGYNGIEQKSYSKYGSMRKPEI